ncbi:BON domain-containing protein [Pseudobdellovibrio exovorus]|uniref:BON domain-containing protein n=1 Tax=Pseudobdellovibrio exovorus JSS TaxID=1184267 RepID=M4VN10_9BACT|nr:BON domain-containing protein [Pseudobdellovibrio exovorus]AGH94464.1 hypothetical protein A11Q_244 [Pseudobdellovibrio exovorus JSS]
MKRNQKSVVSVLVVIMAALLFFISCERKDVANTIPSVISDTDSGYETTNINNVNANQGTMTQIQDTSAQDDRITQSIRQQIASQNTSAFTQDVSVSTTNGMVVLRGSVKTMDEKNRIEGIARGVAGTNRVISEITVAR